MPTLTSVDEQIRELKERQSALEKIKSSYNGAISHALQLMSLTQDNPELREQFWNEFDSVRNGNGTAHTDVAKGEEENEVGAGRDEESHTSLLKSMTIDRLRSLADKLKLRTTSNMTKPKLIEAIALVPKEKIERYIARV